MLYTSSGRTLEVCLQEGLSGRGSSLVPAPFNVDAHQVPTNRLCGAHASRVHRGETHAAGAPLLSFCSVGGIPPSALSWVDPTRDPRASRKLGRRIPFSRARRPVATEDGEKVGRTTSLDALECACEGPSPAAPYPATSSDSSILSLSSVQSSCLEICQVPISWRTVPSRHQRSKLLFFCFSPMELSLKLLPLFSHGPRSIGPPDGSTQWAELTLCPPGARRPLSASFQVQLRSRVQRPKPPRLLLSPQPEC